MLSYFALITLVKLSGLLIPLIWFLIIADRRGRTIGLTLVLLLFIVSLINTYFNLPDLAYPALIDGWLSWLIGGLILVMVLQRMFYSNKPSRSGNDDGFLPKSLTAQLMLSVGPDELYWQLPLHY
ncbi:hypothetical protein NBRC111893_494 [Lentilactobacillus kosonis]|uniref:Uncharacterized protein n=1 Tax=Lentilactobacillus kosonis TaxID=2810561 RepID=A0A401FJ78_9LACO|nr:hypothetical protein [Lentilactobacillus kosonis]GAY72348.1 hypothetical protein NBRC111893_494 [Lentilactobacillus kosonis]